MSIFQKIFGAAPAPAAPAPTGNPTNSHQSAGAAPNGVVPEGATTPPAEPASPIDKFSKVWETTPTEPTNTDPGAAGLTPEKMLEAASKVDFSRLINQDDLKKIVAGGEDAMQAFVSVLNKQSQSIYGQSTVVAQKLVDRAVEQAEARFAAQVPGLVKRQSMREGLVSENPAFNHPAVAPIVEVLQRQMAQQYPNATSAELQILAKDYFRGAAEVLSPQAKPKAAPGTQTVDWEGWVNS